ncbi:MAG: Smr/MutS family protein [Bacteroidales bacterium]|jgi:DNA mismatch repair protein MutS2|nr:Smr/MutS family protein [Bacteroidales bacterium]
MIHPSNFKEKIAFSTVEEILRGHCLSALGQNYVAQLRFETDFDRLFETLSQTEQFKAILNEVGNFPSQDYFDLTETLRGLEAQGNFIEIEPLQQLQASLRTIARILVYMDALDAERFPDVVRLIDEVFLPEDVLKQLFGLLDSQGQIADGASSELRAIRQAIRSKQAETDKRLRRLMQQAKSDGLIAEDAEPSVRNERLVIPILAGQKRKMRGFIHDVSNTGQTVFIEPEDVFNLNNEIRDLENDERLEIIRILKEFTNHIRPHIPELLNAYQFLGVVDFLRAKALLAIEMNAVMPVLSADPELEWWDARHPILEKSLQKQGKKIVSLNIRLDADDRILIISGPNAGGKSVCLKTVGLLQYMLQCGLLIPVNETSEAGIFEHLFLDIGDQQSLENDLSTYSSHLTNMKQLVSSANPKTLFLIDELGGGTEPQIGGAIAESIVEYLDRKHAFGVITTHYANLKLLADRLDGVVNGAMLFDTDSHKPLYALKTGTPGSSFAIEMAENIGLQTFILDAAKQKAGESHLNFEQQLQQLDVEKKILEQNQLEVKLADDLLSQTLEKYNKLAYSLETQKKEILNKAKAEAKKVLDDANKLVEKTIRDIKEAGAEKHATQAIREELSKMKDTVAEHSEGYEGRGGEVRGRGVLHTPKLTDRMAGVRNTPLHILKIGDFVRISEGGAVAEIIEMKKNKAVVSTGLIKMTLPLEQLQYVPKGQVPKQDNFRKSKFDSILNDINTRKINFSPNLDLRGFNAEEATNATLKFLDDATLFSEKHLQILHGRGDGVLRRIVRDILKHNKDVQSFDYEHIERGGDGITLVEMK